MMNTVMKRPLFRQMGSPMGGENSSEQAFVQYLQSNLSPEQLQALMQSPDKEQIIGQLYQKFMSETQAQSSPIAMRQSGTPSTGERSADLMSLLENIKDTEKFRGIIGDQESDNAQRQLGDLLKQPFEEFSHTYVRNPKTNEIEPMSGPLTGTPIELEEPSSIRSNMGEFRVASTGQTAILEMTPEIYEKVKSGELEFIKQLPTRQPPDRSQRSTLDKLLNLMNIGGQTILDKVSDVFTTDKQRPPTPLRVDKDKLQEFLSNNPNFRFDPYKGIVEIQQKAQGGEMEATGIASGLDQEEEMTVDRGPSEEGIAKVSPEKYVQLMNEIRGDEVPLEGRISELSGVVGEADAQATPLSVLTLVQPVFELQEQKGAQQEGIATAPQGQEMMMQGPMPMANGGIAYRQTGSTDLGEVTKQYYSELQNIFPEYGAMQKASLFTPIIKQGLRMASGAPLTGEEGTITGTIADYADILPKIASASTPLKQSSLKLASDALIAEKAAKQKEKEFQQTFMKDVLLKQMEMEGKKVSPIGVVGGSDEANAELTEKIKGMTGVDIDLSNFPVGSVVQIKPTGEIDITKADTSKKNEYTVTYPVIENGVQKTKTKVIDISTPEGIAEFNRLQNEALNADVAAKPLFKFEKISGMSFSPNVPITINPIVPIQKEKDGGIVSRKDGTPPEGEGQNEVIGVTEEFAKSYGDITPQYGAQSQYAELAKGKLSQAETAMENIEKMYQLAYENPLYFGIFGSGTRVGKGVIGALDDVFKGLGYDFNIPFEDFFLKPVVDQIMSLEDSIATSVASVRREQTGKSNPVREINLVKNSMNITGVGNASRAMDSLKQIWEEMAQKANDQRDLLQGVEKKDYKIPEIFNMPKEKKTDEFNLKQFNLIQQMLPDELKNLSMNDPDIKNAISAVVQGADPNAVIDRLKQIKGIE